MRLCPIRKTAVGSYISIFVDWLVLVYRCLCMICRLGIILRPLHVSKWRKCHFYQIQHPYYRLGTLHFVEICGIFMHRTIFQCIFLFRYHLYAFWIGDTPKNKKKNMAVSTIIDMKCSFTPNCCWRAVRTEFFRIWWNFKHINHTNCTLFCHLTSILLQRFIGESSLTAIFLSIGTAVHLHSRSAFFSSLSLSLRNCVKAACSRWNTRNMW